MNKCNTLIWSVIDSLRVLKTINSAKVMNHTGIDVGVEKHLIVAPNEFYQLSQVS